MTNYKISVIKGDGGLIEDPTVKKVEKTAEEELAEAIRKLAETKAS